MTMALALATMTASAMMASRIPASVLVQPRSNAPRAVVLASTWTDLTEDAKRLTDASIARTVASVAKEGVLCTDIAGFDGNFLSSSPFLVQKTGDLIMPIAFAEVATNLAESKSVTFHAKAPRGGAASESALSLMGTVAMLNVDDDISEADIKDVSTSSGKSVEELAKQTWVRLSPERVHVSDAVRNVQTWVPSSEYAEAEPNPLAAAATTLLGKLNNQHTLALLRFAAIYTGLPTKELSTAEVISVDQMGFDMRVQLSTSSTPSLVRAGFKLPPANAEEGTSIFMKLFQEAYERENGSLA